MVTTNEETFGPLTESPAMVAWLARRFGHTPQDSADEALLTTCVKNALADGTLTPEKASELVGEDHGFVPDVQDVEYLREAAEELRAEELDMAIERGVDAMLSQKNERNQNVKTENQGSTRADFAAGFMAKAAMNQQTGQRELQTNAFARGTEPGVKIGNRSYSMFKSVGRHAKTDREVTDFNQQPCMEASEYELAGAGAFVKFLAQRSGLQTGWGAEEVNLFSHIVNHEPWCGKHGIEWQTNMRGPELKAVLDSTTSGGSYLSPNFFDLSIVQAAILYGELLPNVDTIPIPRGSTVEGATLTAPTVSWGGTEGTARTVFDTTGMINDFSKTIHPVDAFIELGLDLLSDSVADLGKLLVSALGEKLSESLDEQISIGDGVSEPEGIFTASGLNSVSSSNSTGGPFTLGDFEALSMTAGKQYLNPVWRPSFILSNYQYRQARAVPVGSSDARRLMGVKHSEYMLLEWPARIQDSISNGSVAFGPLKKYRLYRRQGGQTRFTTEGQTLTLKNTALLSLRGRYGGWVSLPAAFSKMTDGPTSYGN
jgi:HK97 family phage major capsid protein